MPARLKDASPGTSVKSKLKGRMLCCSQPLTRLRWWGFDGGGAPLKSGGQMVAGVGVGGESVDQDVAILESALRDAEIDRAGAGQAH
jgi:uncharacterized protein GlcG (DUF336 family)